MIGLASRQAIPARGSTIRPAPFQGLLDHGLLDTFATHRADGRGLALENAEETVGVPPRPKRSEDKVIPFLLDQYPRALIKAQCPAHVRRNTDIPLVLHRDHLHRQRPPFPVMASV